jgi:hypothetical protein
MPLHEMKPFTHARLNVVLLLLLVSFALSTRAEETKSEYSAPEIGWRTLLPAKAWPRMSAQAKSQLEEKGKKLAEKASGEAVDTKALMQLLNLQKDAKNTFLSTIEPYDEAKNGSYAENNNKVKQVILDAYKAANLKMGHVRDGKELVDGLEFTTLELEIMHPQKPEEVLLTQKMYSRLINGYDFCMTLNTDNAKDRRTLETVVADSKFFIRK